MGIKRGAKELVKIANRIALENNIDIKDTRDENKAKLGQVWAKATKEFDDRYKTERI